MNNPSNCIWTKHFEEMAKKTVIKRLCKSLPMEADIDMDINAENRDTIEMEPVKKEPTQTFKNILEEKIENSEYKEVKNA